MNVKRIETDAVFSTPSVTSVTKAGRLDDERISAISGVACVVMYVQ
jgi:hypothetical protein